MYRKGHLNQNIIDRCCNFPLLEEKCIECERELSGEYLSNYKKKNLNADEDLDM